MYCIRCGAAYTLKYNDPVCPYCGKKEAYINPKYARVKLMYGTGLLDNYIPIFCELVLLAIVWEIISLIICVSLPDPLESYGLSFKEIIAGANYLAQSVGIWKSLAFTASNLGFLWKQVSIYSKLSFYINTTSAVLITVIFLIGICRLFKKGGRRGWEAIIPFYSGFYFFEIALGRGSLFLIVLVYLALGTASFFMVGSWTMPIFLLGLLVFHVWFSHKLAKQFHRGLGYTLGLVFIPFLFVSLLGWGKDATDMLEL